MRDLKAGKSVDKPIYNHVSGNLDAPEKTDSPNVGDSKNSGRRVEDSCAHGLRSSSSPSV